MYYTTTTPNVLYRFSQLTYDYIDWVMGVENPMVTADVYEYYTVSKKNNNNKIL
jgi:hypothetical protein